MNPIEQLAEELQRRFPGGTFRLTAPLRPTDQWTLDIRHGSRRLVVDWTPPERFGISSATDGSLYGEGPDEAYSDPKEALERVAALLCTEEQASPPLPALLSRIREDLRFTQAQLALKLGVAQATISGIERRKDIQLSTLQRFVEAMGGVLRVVAQFQGASYVVQAGQHPSFNKVVGEPREPMPKTERVRFSFPLLANTGRLQEAERISGRVCGRGVLAA